MPLPLIPLIFGGIALATGSTGVVKGIKAISDNKDANDINDHARNIYNNAKKELETARDKMAADPDYKEAK